MEEKKLGTEKLITRKDFEAMSDKDFELYMYNLRKQAEVNLQSSRTYMTGLYNLRAFQYKASEEMLLHPELNHAMIVMDFSNFKAINEFCGRQDGDLLLVSTAEAFKDEEATNERLITGHFRADIFAIFTDFTDQKELIDITERISKKISDVKIAYKVLPAFGICIADHNDMAVSLMRDYATMALNTIKGKFYARYAFFDEEMKNAMLFNKMIENDIVKALEQNQLHLYIQPKVDMKSGNIIGGEALVRWIHPERGMVSPNEFIPILEKNGLIIDVDIYIWREVFKFLGDRIKQGKHVVPISINISRQHVFDKGFRQIIVDLAREYDVPPRLVPLELTESGFLESTEKMFESMKYLKEQGFIISMDDFGTGYSTMTMLKNQPVDEIKIDRGFIVDIENNKNQAIIKHTIDMLHDLDMSVIVEGVEEKAQQEFLLECGCDNAQGFYFYRPVPRDEFEKLLEN